jgi:2-dehydro-3-deoxy-D-gluconate 5-dehydrogenase
MNLSMFDLCGKIALVTGGNGGIGRGIALGLAGCGADIAIAARDADKLAVVAAEIEAAGRQALTLVCDVSQRESVVRAISRIVTVFGGLDIVVNCAGINGIAPGPEKIAPQTWDAVLATNLTGTHLVSTIAYPELVKRGGGKIINISSMMAIFGGKTLAAYAATKGGLEQYTKSCAVAWATDNIQVNAIAPGWITTDMTRGSRSDAAKYGNIIDRTPAGRYGEPGDLAGAAVFLASRAADFVSGACLPVDGGYASQGTSRTIGV